MVAKLSTIINKIQNLPNSSNAKIINEFLMYMKNNGSSERHQNNNLNVIIEFTNFLDPKTIFFDINKKEQILSFLNTKIKDSEKDPEKRWITSWNHYLTRIKLFFRWLYNKDKEIDKDYWETHDFLKIKNKKTKRISPYVESEIWEKDELLSILKYEPYKRHKAAITLMWDLYILFIIKKEWVSLESLTILICMYYYFIYYWMAVFVTMHSLVSPA